MNKICAVCGEIVEGNAIACPKCGRGVFHSRANTEISEQPKNQDSDVTDKLMREQKYAAAAKKYLDAFISNPGKESAILNCGVCFWQSVKKYLSTLSQMTFDACRCRTPDQLMLTYLVNPAKFPGTLYAQQLRKVVPASDLARLSKCLEVAERCFTLAGKLGDKSIPLLWMVTLTRGTGRYEDCRNLVRQASADSTIPAKEIEEAKKWAEDIKKWEQDLASIDNRTGGWVIPNNYWLKSSVLDEISPVVEEADRVLLSHEIASHTRTQASSEDIHKKRGFFSRLFGPKQPSQKRKCLR